MSASVVHTQGKRLENTGKKAQIQVTYCMVSTVPACLSASGRSRMEISHSDRTSRAQKADASAYFQADPITIGTQTAAEKQNDAVMKNC